jgi:transcription elongation factor Elf1
VGTLRRPVEDSADEIALDALGARVARWLTCPLCSASVSCEAHGRDDEEGRLWMLFRCSRCELRFDTSTRWILQAYRRVTDRDDLLDALLRRVDVDESDEWPSSWRLYLKPTRDDALDA